MYDLSMVQKIIAAVVAILVIMVVGRLQSLPNPQSSPPPTAVQSATQPSAVHSSAHSLTDTLAYLNMHGTLPSYYLTKQRAASLGWIPSKGNLEDVAPHELCVPVDVLPNSLSVTAKRSHKNASSWLHSCQGRRGSDCCLANSARVLGSRIFSTIPVRK